MKRLLLSLLLLAGADAFAAEANLPLVSAMEMPYFVGQRIRTVGTLRDVFDDERDPDYAFFLVQTKNGVVYATYRKSNSRNISLHTLIDATVEVRGFCLSTNDREQPRRYLGYFLMLSDALANNLVVIRPPPMDPFSVPEIDEDLLISPAQLQQLGRRRMRGFVLAVGKGQTVLVETQSGGISRISLAGDPLPDIGSFVEVVGFPDTDLYRLNLTRAIWRSTDPWPRKTAAARPTSAKAILTDRRGRPCVNTQAYGKRIRLSGRVHTLQHDHDGTVVLQVDDNGFLFSVDTTACPETTDRLTAGCLISVTGICLMNTYNCRPNASFPQVNGFTVLPQSPDDVIVLERPSWWTAQRLAYSLLVALVGLVGILIWNRSLSVLAERRGRQLADERLGHATSELKVVERTRLSAELHDALSQTLSGIAMQLGAIKRFARTDSERMLRHLDIASRTLKSCRDEMRNLLWDLRSQVLDEPDIEKALWQILEPHLDETRLRIRFVVPRARLSDSTARALFCIVRELTANAIRHGKASNVRIAGSLENGRLLCSVRDDGCGFDPGTAPGAGEGHFGLQGIRERMDVLDGTVTIDSAPGKGTKVTISMAAPNEEEENR